MIEDNKEEKIFKQDSQGRKGQFNTYS